VVTWDQCRDYFAADGSLRDIYTRGGRLDSWRALLRILAPTSPSFEVDSESRAVPATVEEAFEASRESAVVLRTTWGGVLLCCHFFDPEQVEVDLAPQDVHSEERFSAVLDFMLTLARESGRNVVITPENQHEEPLIEVTPTGVVTDVGN
jgi:hypothetical protein